MKISRSGCKIRSQLIHAYSTTQQLINRAMKIMKQRSVASEPGVHEHLHGKVLSRRQDFPR